MDGDQVEAHCHFAIDTRAACAMSLFPRGRSAMRQWQFLARKTAQLVSLIILMLHTPSLLANDVLQGKVEQKVVDVFVRDGCPHCARAKVFLSEFAKLYPEMKIVLHEVDRDEVARDALIRHSVEAGIWPPGVPSFVYGDKIIVGFDNPLSTGDALRALIADEPASAQSLDSELFGTLSVSRLGLPLFTIALGLLDGVNPCAMWVLLFLLSFLIHLRDRKRIALIAGTFVFVSGAVYYAFMAAWLNLFLLVGITSFVRWFLGGAALIIGAINLRDFLRPGDGYVLAIPAAAKPGMYTRMRSILAADSLLPALAAVFTLAVVVNFIELLCTAGLPALYTAVLVEQGLSPVAHYAYLGLYILGYMADDAILVTLAVIALNSKKLSATSGRWLKLISAAAMLVLGSVMLLRPEWLI